MVDTHIPSPLAKFKTRLASSPPEDESHGNGKQARTKPLEQMEGTLTGSGLDLEICGHKSWNSLGLRE
jgi:hypothetical protein